MLVNALVSIHSSTHNNEFIKDVLLNYEYIEHECICAIISTLLQTVNLDFKLL